MKVWIVAVEWTAGHFENAFIASTREKAEDIKSKIIDEFIDCPYRALKIEEHTIDLENAI